MAKKLNVLIFVIFSLINTYADAGVRKQGACEETVRALNGSLSPAWIKKMLLALKPSSMSAEHLRDDVQKGGLNAVGLNPKIYNSHTDNYTWELPSLPISNQAQSGRCWDFSYELMISDQLLSPNYPFFYHLLEQGNNYFQDVIENKTTGAIAPNISEGAWDEQFPYLMKNYGLVPYNLMPETASSQNTRAMMAEIKQYLAEWAYKIESAKRKMLEDRVSDAKIVERLDALKNTGLIGYSKLLATHLGTPPALDKEFQFDLVGNPGSDGIGVHTPIQTKLYNPFAFAAAITLFKPEDQVVIASNPLRPEGFYKEIKSDAYRMSSDGSAKILNVSMARLQQLTLTALLGGQRVRFDADVTHDVEYSKGIMHPDIYDDNVYDLKKSESPRPLNRVNSVRYYLADPDHAMVKTAFHWPGLEKLVPKAWLESKGLKEEDRYKPGVAIIWLRERGIKPGDEKKILKTKVQNSWGTDVGTLGIFHDYQPWSSKYEFSILVDKKFLSPEELGTWNFNKPTLLKEEFWSHDSDKKPQK
ncbi:MAG: aminopeptidase [Bacteriovoracaceae bacterium]|nr:aminopeptidase [Bacteriovoracaceae bacterium]